MDFQSLKQGSPIYVLQEGGTEPQLTVATVMNKPEPKPMYMTQTPGATPGIYAGTNMMQPVVEIVAHIGNEDIPFSNLTPTASTATYNNGQTTISCTMEGMLPAIDAMMQKARKHFEERPYNDAVMVKGKEFLMSLNPRYKEEEEQKQDIANLKGQMGDVLKTMNTMMSMMQDLNKKISGTSSKSK